MKPKSRFLQSSFFNMLLPFLMVMGLGIAAWPSIRPKQTAHFPQRDDALLTASIPEDNFQRPEAKGKLPEEIVSAIKRESDATEWDDNYRVVFQLNFPESTRAAFVLIVRHQESKCLLMALADTRSNEWRDKLWIGSAVDEQLNPDNHAIPFEMDEVRRIQHRNRKFRPYWNHPSHIDELLTKDSWLASMALALMRKDPVKLD